LAYYGYRPDQKGTGTDGRHIASANAKILQQMANDFTFPPSVQADLFNYLTEEQQAFLKPILRILKLWAQEELCIALIDYLETGNPEPPATNPLNSMFYFILENSITNPKNLD